MRINSMFLIASLLIPSISSAENGHEDHSQLFHAFTFETQMGEGREGRVSTWDLDGWMGGDFHKLWIKSEGERAGGETHSAEFWALYSRNVATFWDAQIGLRYDTHPTTITYLTAGVAGLAPYFFETEAHIFVSDQGDVTARIKQENDFLITQKLIMQPYLEVQFSAQDIEEQEIGAGLTHGELGLQTRYEIARKFAPYIDVRYERKWGETAAIARHEGEEPDDFITSIGVRLMF